MKIAALDLGTNTFLCLIAEGDKSGITKVHKDLVEVVRLGQDVDKTGELHPEALVRAKKCLTEFKKEIDKHNVDKILAMATSAARDAKNGQALFDIGKELGIPIEVIPGEDEARISYQGASGGVIDPTKTNLVIDVGGGSTEFIVGHGEKILFGESLNMGGVRLTERFVTQQPVPLAEQNKLNDYINEQLQTILPKIRQNKLDQILAVAGTPTSIVAIEVGGFDEKKVDNYFLSKERLDHWVQTFAQTSVEEKRSRYQLGGRADIIFAGASILLNTVKSLGMAGIVVSTKGVRYGVALEMLRSGDHS
ncbi:Ppx/GppA family phosphatase [Bdellovibrio sp. SKB1291214]|uniref:Ppx/GppA phosphatase family protein n=1 Tax=Bdellovibrio sp. SKB1291214 TaxID=1732569 RepID=UPI000B51C7EF|nr:Ppx/GppA phosphatase family protein [Bdellovibrio sp. SKB1291214]UYL10495.1 Ppx/GppA family phosphatase [Bdellovibrio sp. SKB1291214]